MNIQTEIQNAQKQMNRDRASQEHLQERLEREQNNLSSLKELADDLLEVRSLFQVASQLTQQKLEFHISSLVSTALSAVFPDPYEFKVKFEQRRNKTECDLTFTKNGEDYGSPMFASGGGPKDVAAFALRCAFWSLDKKSRNILILDEPFNFVNDDPKEKTRELQQKCVEMFKRVVDTLGMQAIVVTTLPEFLNVADKIFSVSCKSGISQIKEISYSGDSK